MGSFIAVILLGRKPLYWILPRKTHFFELVMTVLFCHHYKLLIHWSLLKDSINVFSTLTKCSFCILTLILYYFSFNFLLPILLQWSNPPNRLLLLHNHYCCCVVVAVLCVLTVNVHMHIYNELYTINLSRKEKLFLTSTFQDIFIQSISYSGYPLWILC